MIDLALQAIDTIVDLLKFRANKEDRFFENQVAPVFAEMETVHHNYLESFNELKRLTETAENRDTLIRSVLAKKMEFEHLRIKVHSFSRVVLSEDRSPAPARGFFRGCLAYFNHQDQLADNPYSSHYSSIQEMLIGVEAAGDFERSRDKVLGFVLSREEIARRSWEFLTTEYSKCKLAMKV